MQIRMFLKSHFANLSEVLSEDIAAGPTLAFSSCFDCGLQFGSPQQLSLHRFKAHGAKHAIRTYVNTTFCVVCLREFWCRDRLLNHLRYRSKTCYNNIVLRGPVLSIAEADIFDAAEHVKNAKLSKMGKRSHFASITSVRLIGPLQPILLPEPNRESAHHPLGRGHNVH